MGHMLIFGMGYAAGHIAERLRARGWEVSGTTRDGRGDSIAFADEAAVLREIHAAELASSDPASAKALASTGQAPRTDGLDDAEVAAMTLVCSAIMNTDAATTRR